MSLIGRTALIIGAGIGGLAVARALALRGMRVKLLEQAEAIAEVGAGLQISPNGFAVLNALGLGSAVRAAAMQAQAVVLRDYRRGAVARLDLTQLENPAYYFLHRADLIDILAQGAREAGVSVRLLQKVDRLEAGERPAVVMANGDRCGADLIIGADGLHSVARKLLNGTSAPFFTGQTAWRAIVPNTEARGPEAWVHMAPGRHLVSYPLRGGKDLNIVAVQERRTWVEEGWHLKDDPENLRQAFADAGPEVTALLDRVDTAHLWGLFRHPVAPKWHDQSIALLGDAAHPTLPFLAQGASMALEDAWALAECLSTTDDVTAGLASYQARRVPRVTKVVEAANGNARKYHLRMPPVRAAAHLGLKTISTFAPGFLLRHYDWLYTHDETKPV